MPTGVTGPESPVSTTTSIALATIPWTFGLRYFGVPRHAVLEPLRVVGQLPDAARLLLVHVEHEPFPRALGAARVEVDLDEPVDGVDGRILVLHPRDVVLRAVGVLTGPIPLDQRAQRIGHRLGRKRDRRLEVADDVADLGRVAAVDLVDLLGEPAVLLDEPRVQAVFLGEPLQVRQGDAAGVEVVRACLQDVPCRRRASCW